MANSISLKHDDNGFLLGRKLDKAQFDKNLKQTLDNTKSIIKKLDGRRVGNRIVVSGSIKHESKGNKQPVVISNSPRNRPSTANVSNTTNKRRVINSNSLHKSSKAPNPSMIVSSVEGIKVKGKRSNVKHSNQGKVAMDARASKQFTLRQERAQQKLSLEDAKEQRNQTDLLETIAKKIGGGSGKSESLLSKLLPGLPFSPKFLGGGLLGKVLGGFLGGKKGGAVHGGLGGGNPAKQAGKGLLGGVLSKGKGLLGKAAKIKGLGFLGLGLTALGSIGVENSEMDRGDKNKQHLKNGMSLGGALAGGAAGMKAGAVLGSVVPGLGTGVGAILGGLVGSFAGAGVADYAMDAIDDAIDPKLSKKMLGSWDGFVSTTKQGLSTLWKEMPQPVQNAGNYVAEKFEAANKVVTAVNSAVADAVGTVAGGVRNNVNDSVVGKTVQKTVEGAKKLVGIGGGGQSAESLENKLIKTGLLANNGTKVSKHLLRKNVPESVAGGLSHAGTYAAAIDSIDSDVRKFTAFQDSYHINANAKSYHNKGLAFDVTYKNAKGGSGKATINKENAKQFQPKADAIKERMKAAGLKEGADFRVVNEYDPKQAAKHTTGGHIHVEIRNKEAAAKYAQFTSDSMGDAKTKEPVGLIPKDSKLQRSNDAARRNQKVDYISSTATINSTGLGANKTGLHDGTLYLSSQDIEDIVKVASTEVAVGMNGENTKKQTAGVVDTILNRISMKGGNVRAVLNKELAFSAINSKEKGAWGSVQNMPRSAIKPIVEKAVLEHLKMRDSGQKSSVDGNTHYANPNALGRASESTKRWVRDVQNQAKQTGYIFGEGKRIHVHGTPTGERKAKAFKVSVSNSSKFVAPPKAAPVPNFVKVGGSKNNNQLISNSYKESAAVVGAPVIIESKPNGKHRQTSQSINVNSDVQNSPIAHLPTRQVSQNQIAYAASGGTSG